MSAEQPTAAAPRPAGALRSLGEGLRLAHAEFLRLYPLALAVGVALELVAVVTRSATVGALFGMLPRDVLLGRSFSPGLVLFLLEAMSTFGFLAPVTVATAVLATAVRARLRGRPARPLASLAHGARALHVALATAVAFSIVPVAALWFPWTTGETGTLGRIYAWVLPLSLPLAAAVIARWLFAVPAAVLERRGPIAAWRRSERLGGGHQLPTFGLVLLGSAGWLLADGIAATLLSFAAMSGAPPDPHSWGEPEGFGRALEFARVAIAAWFHLCIATVTVVYFERVRLAKEGPDADELKSVFN